MTPSQLTAVLLILFGAAYFIMWLLKEKGVFDRAADKRAFQKHFGKKVEGVYSSAGRINVIGEHIDYCGGKVLPAALGLKCHVVGAKNNLDEIRFIFKGGKEIVHLPLADLPSCKTLKIGSYQAGVAYGLQQAGVKVVGCDLYYRCDVPFGGALSSSAAIEAATALALLSLSGGVMSVQEIVLLCQKAEHDFAGVNCGVMDQFASAFGKKGNAIYLDCATLDYQYVPVNLGKYTFLLANCNRPHALSDGKYNERRQETEEALAIAKKKFDVDNLCALSIEDVKSLEGDMPKNVYARAMHVAAENARVNEAIKALEEGDMITLGNLLDLSHDSLKNLFEVSCAETDALQQCLRSQKGCVGARMIGGGFGGCVLALVENSQAEACERHAYREYEKAVGYPPTFYPVEIGDGATSRLL